MCLPVPVLYGTYSLTVGTLVHRCTFPQLKRQLCHPDKHLLEVEGATMSATVATSTGYETIDRERLSAFAPTPLDLHLRIFHLCSPPQTSPSACAPLRMFPLTRPSSR